MLTVAERGRGKICRNLADVICERSHTISHKIAGDTNTDYVQRS